VLYNDFRNISDHRGGRLWDSAENMNNRIRNLPKDSARKKFDSLFVNELENYYNDIYKM